MDANKSEIEITRQMIEAGIERLCELLEAGTGSAYVVSEVFQAMMDARAKDSVAHASMNAEQGKRID